MNNPLRSFRKHQPDVNALSARLDSMLDPRASARLDGHLASCDACRAQLDGLRTTRATLRSMPEESAPRSFRLRVADTVPVSTPRSPALRWAPVAGAFAGVVVAVVVGASLYSSGGSSNSQETAKSQRSAAPLNSAPRPTTALDSAGAALEAGAATAADANGPIAPDITEIVPSTGEIAPPEAAAPSLQPTSEAAEGADTSLDYSTTNTFAIDAARAVATAAVQIQAAAAAAPEDDGNNSAAVYVMVIIGVAAAFGAAAIAIRWWRNRGEA